MTSREYPKTIIIDFDGTLCKFAFPDVGKAEPNAKEVLTELKELGYKICIHSVRTATYWGEGRKSHISAIINFLKENEIPYDSILLDDNMDKPIAELYIDDRGLRYEGNWLNTIKQVKELLGK